MNIQVLQAGELIGEGKPERIREFIEERLADRFGYHASLQEDVEDGVYTLCLHSDVYDTLSDTQIEELDREGINEDPEDATPAISFLLGLTFHIV